MSTHSHKSADEYQELRVINTQFHNHKSVSTCRQLVHTTLTSISRANIVRPKATISTTHKLFHSLSSSFLEKMAIFEKEKKVQRIKAKKINKQ